MDLLLRQVDDLVRPDEPRSRVADACADNVIAAQGRDDGGGLAEAEALRVIEAGEQAGGVLEGRGEDGVDLGLRSRRSPPRAAGAVGKDDDEAVVMGGHGGAVLARRWSHQEGVREAARSHLCFHLRLMPEHPSCGKRGQVAQGGRMSTHQVVIVGAGPTGLMLAGELAVAGVDVVIVERRATQDLVGNRAGGLIPRTLECLDQRGIVERFLAQGTRHHVVGFVMAPLDITDLPTRHNYYLGIWQEPTERLLAAWVEERGASIQRGVEVVAYTQSDAGVAVKLSDGRTLHAQYLVGCDGGRSAIRKGAGIELVGADASVSYLIAEVAITEVPPVGIKHTARGNTGFGPVGTGRFRVVVTEAEVITGEAPTLAELRAALRAVYGTDFGVHSPSYLSRFTDATRQATTYRAGRVLIAGDAAHVHSPAGGQGLNLGVQDAVNLGWKLAQVVHGTAPDALLDTYTAERHPVGAKILKATMAITAANRGDAQTAALKEVFTDLLAIDEARIRYAGLMTGLDIHYDLGPGHPLLGRRMPDLDLDTPEGPRRVSQLLHTAQPVHLDFTGPRRVAGPWVLPVIGAVPAPATVTIRPDGYVSAVT